MLIDTPQARVPLRRGQFSHLHLAPHARVRGLSGQTWLTLDHDARDIVLGPGDEFVSEHGGRAIACALRIDDGAEFLVTA